MRRPMIILRDIELRRGSKLLFEGANANVQPGQRLALIGANGCGKSSLFSLLLGELGADRGTIEGMHNLRVAHMAQEVHDSGQSAGEFVWRGDPELSRLRDELARLESAGRFEDAAGLHSRLEEIDGYSAERRVEILLAGLGFAESDPGRPLADFSGGWRIRLGLARALMTPSDLLLLDEPTNHLDLDATLWLQQWLQGYTGTLIMISHDRDFIDATCTRILHIEHRQLFTYRGNYSQFERQRAERLASEQAARDKQQRRTRDIEAFVARFRYKASKAKQAQSRLKELERMQALAPAHADSPFDFRFPDPGRTSDPLLQLRGASLGYGGAPVLAGVDVAFRPGSRFGLLGRNGAGKSTLLKSLAGTLPLLAGERLAGDRLRVGYFDQQQLEALDLAAGPGEHIRRLDPAARDQDIRDFLGGFNFHGDAASAPVGPLSGGEKARLALALVVWCKPNLLVLDEPTNHLDLDMRHAMELALQDYRGALVLVSHDRHLLRNTVDQLLLVHDGTAQEYREDLAAYERWMLSSYRDRMPADAAEKGGGSGLTSRREQRQRAAARREQLRPLKKRLQETEREMTAVADALADIRDRLAQETLYAADQRHELDALLRRQGQLQNRAGELDEAWLEQQQALEELEGP